MPPHRYPDLAALVGESSDNLPGIPGVGPKTAAKWIGQYDGLEGILASADQVPGKAGESLRDNLDQVRLNRQLNALLTDLELPLGPEDLAVRPWDRPALHAILEELEFRAIRDRLFAMLPDESGEGPGTVAAAQIDHAVLGAGELAGWLAERAGRPLGVDVRGSGAPASGDAWGIALADPDGQAAVVRPRRRSSPPTRRRWRRGSRTRPRPRSCTRPRRRGTRWPGAGCRSPASCSTPSSPRTCASRTGARTT